VIRISLFLDTKHFPTFCQQKNLKPPHSRPQHTDTLLCHRLVRWLCRWTSCLSFQVGRCRLGWGCLLQRVGLPAPSQ